MLEFNCSACRNDPQLKEMWGCVEPSQSAVWVDEETGDEYFSCPVKFITEEVYKWFDEYQFYKSFNTALDYWSLTERWLDAVAYYERKLIEYKMEINSKKNPDHTTKGLKVLKDSFNGRKM